MSRLNDHDIETIREVLRRKNENLIESTAERVKEVLEIAEIDDPDLFLKNVVNDYAFMATKEA